MTKQIMLSKISSFFVLIAISCSLGLQVAIGQTGVAYFPEKEKLSPFEMSSVFFSVMQYNYNDTVIKNTGNDLKLKNNATQVIYTVGIDQPIYDKYIGGGINLGLSYGTNPFTSVVVDSTLSLNFRCPFDLGSGGDIALTSSAGGGFSLMLAGTAGERTIPAGIIGEANRTSAENTLTNQNRFITLKPGMVGTLSAGIDYYPIKWLGVFAEVQTRHYKYFDSAITKKITKGEDVGIIYNKNFSFTVEPALVIGLKTTF